MNYQYVKHGSALLSMATVVTTCYPASTDSVRAISRYFCPEVGPSRPRWLGISRLLAPKEGTLRLLRFVLAIVLPTALYAGLSSYAEFISTPPPCALENHHGPGNCSVQVLRWYPMTVIRAWHLTAP
jgi:hypothetical protein